MADGTAIPDTFGSTTGAERAESGRATTAVATSLPAVPAGAGSWTRAIIRFARNSGPFFAALAILASAAALLLSALAGAASQVSKQFEALPLEPTVGKRRE